MRVSGIARHALPRFSGSVVPGRVSIRFQKPSVMPQRAFQPTFTLCMGRGSNSYEPKTQTSVERHRHELSPLGHGLMQLLRRSLEAYDKMRAQRLSPDFHTFGTLLRWRRARTCSAGWRRLRLCGRSCRRDVAWVHVSKQPACPVVYICVPCSACIVYTSGPWHCVICARIALWAWLHAVCNIHVLGIPLFIGSPV